jgi:hypothetical protein
MMKAARASPRKGTGNRGRALDSILAAGDRPIVFEGSVVCRHHRASSFVPVRRTEVFSKAIRPATNICLTTLNRVGWLSSPAFVLLTIKREDTNLTVGLYASLLHLINIFDSLLPQHAV